MSDQYLTKERLEKLTEKLNDLKTRKRADVAKRLRRAKELGDLSENSEYQEAREEQQKVERKILELEGILKEAVVIEKTGSDTIGVGSTVEVERDGSKMTLTIVGPNEANPDKQRISHESPIGQALMEKKQGDTIAVRTPRGETKYEILKVS